VGDGERYGQNAKSGLRDPDFATRSRLGGNGGIIEREKEAGDSVERHQSVTFRGKRVPREDFRYGRLTKKNQPPTTPPTEIQLNDEVEFTRFGG